MALDTGTSAHAAALQTPTHTGYVKAAILGLFADYGPMTDDELTDRYLDRAGAHPHVPLVTPQSIRTRRADLTREGRVRDQGMLGWSKLGNPATVWGLS